MSQDQSQPQDQNVTPPELAATCALCGQPLDRERDDLYAELCDRCEQRSLKGRQRRERRPGPRSERFSKSGKG